MAQEQPQVRPEDALQALGQASKADPAALLTELAQQDHAAVGEQDLAATLDATAFRAKMGKEDALSAMAKGEWKEEDEAAPPEPTAAPSGDGQATIVPSDAPRSSRPDARVLAAKARAAQSDSLKRFFVPLLLVVGGLLWLLGGGVAVMSMLGRIQTDALKIIMIVSAFPLGAFLMLGAWLFHRDAKR